MTFIFMAITSQVEAKTFLELYFSSINKKVTDFIYLQNVFSEILHDSSSTYRDTDYGSIHKKTEPLSINKARKALKYLRLNEYAAKQLGALSGWERVENIRGNEGFRATVFRQNNHIVLAYIGAEVGTSDWITDGISQSGEIADQYVQALDLAQRYISDFPHAHIVMTGYSLGGALATFAGLYYDKEIITLNHLSLNQKSIDFIKAKIDSDGYPAHTFLQRARNILNISFAKEFVTDGDSQQDGDGLFNHQIIGDIYYIDDTRFKPILLDNPIFRHLLPALKEELEFLSNPYYRINSSDFNLDNNPIHQAHAAWYMDSTLDDFDILLGTSRYIIDSIPSLLEDLRRFFSSSR